MFIVTMTGFGLGVPSGHFKRAKVDGLNWKLFDGVILMHVDESNMFYELFAEISLGGF